ncbi:MAG: translation factor Sua5, partial [Herbaspirillum sp.]|nr:translation factor Sua5 [Herbaspirillum sp.]
MNDKSTSSGVHIDAAAIMHAARKLEQGGLVAFPTETVYGLGG